MAAAEPRVAKIGLGIVTYNRPEYLEKTWRGVVKHVLPYIDEVAVYNDGSSKSYNRVFKKISQVTDSAIFDETQNCGVGHAKNKIMQYLLDKGCDYIFVLEDDIIPVSDKLIPTYLAAHRMTGIDHLMFAHHGPANQAAIDITGPIVWWPNCVGAFTFYTREILEKIGLMDENFHNAWEHVEHSWRIMKHHKVPYGYWPDVIGSEALLKEIPGSIEKSSIGEQTSRERIRIIIDGLNYWKKKEKKFPAQHTLDYYNNLLKEMIEEDR